MIEYLRNLHTLKPSIQLAQYLSTLQMPKEQSADLFIAGVKEFARIANLNGIARTGFFGTPFGGLHYSTDLQQLWDNTFPTKIPLDRLFCLAPSVWQDVMIKGARMLIYKGDKPSEALDKLLQGPTIIDCGMFCQLSIYFGIRYILGNDRFNEVFSKIYIHITQYLYEKSTDLSSPQFKNPFEQFSTTARNADSKAVNIIAIVNYPYYKAKHPAGNSQVNNCLQIDGMYTIFGPTLSKTMDIPASVIEEHMLQKFNDPQTIDDKKELAYFATQKNKIHPITQLSYEELIRLAEEWKNLTMDMKTWKNHEAFGNPKYTFRFDLEKFKHWLKTIPQKNASSSQFSSKIIINLRQGNNLVHNAFTREVSQVRVCKSNIKINNDNTVTSEIKISDNKSNYAECCDSKLRP